MKWWGAAGFFLSLAIFNCYYFFGFFTPYNYFTAKWDVAHGKAALLVYGELSLDEAEAVQVAPEFGFQRLRVAGYTVTIPFVNGITDYNAVVWSYLTEKNGEGWWKAYERRVSQVTNQK